MSIAKLTSLSTQTLSLLLERQRVQSLSSLSPSTLHLSQITKNLQQLRAGIITLQENEGKTEAVSLLRTQYDKMREMAGSDSGVER